MITEGSVSSVTVAFKYPCTTGNIQFECSYAIENNTLFYLFHFF